jgi:hypothetical protein
MLDNARAEREEAFYAPVPYEVTIEQTATLGAFNGLTNVLGDFSSRQET